MYLEKDSGLTLQSFITFLSNSSLTERTHDGFFFFLGIHVVNTCSSFAFELPVEQFFIDCQNGKTIVSLAHKEKNKAIKNTAIGAKCGKQVQTKSSVIVFS